MSKKQQITKNIQLSEKLADFLADKKVSGGTSYVVFSATDKKLNIMNNKLIASMMKKGKKVVKAEEAKGNKNSWTFTPITP